MDEQHRSRESTRGKLARAKLSRRGVVRSALVLGATPALASLQRADGALAAPAVIASRQGDAKPESLNMLYATVEADVEAIRLAIPDWETATGITMNLDSQPYDALQQKVFAELASESDFYDVIIVDTPWTPALTGRLEPLSGYLTDAAVNDLADLALDDYIEKVFFDTAVYNPDESHLQYPDPSAVDLATIAEQGFEVYGLPLQANALVAMYRHDLFDAEAAAFEGQVGRPLTFPVNVDEFAEVAKFFTRPDENLYGTTLMPGTGDWATDDFKTFLAAWGGNGYMINDDFTIAFNGQEGIDALTWYVSLINEHKVTPPGVTSFSWDDASATFTQGLTAMSMNYHTEVLSPDVQGRIAYALVPEKVARGPHFGTWMLSVNKYGKNKPWAYRAVQWFTSGETQTKMLAAQLHPSRKSVYEAAKTDPNATKFGNFYDILGQSLAVGVGRPRLTNYGAVDQVIWVAVNNAANGTQSPEEALNEAATKVTDLLREEGYPVP